MRSTLTVGQRDARNSTSEVRGPYGRTQVHDPVGPAKVRGGEARRRHPNLRCRRSQKRTSLPDRLHRYEAPALPQESGTPRDPQDRGLIACSIGSTCTSSCRKRGGCSRRRRAGIVHASRVAPRWTSEADATPLAEPEATFPKTKNQRDRESWEMGLRRECSSSP